MKATKVRKLQSGQSFSMCLGLIADQQTISGTDSYNYCTQPAVEQNFIKGIFVALQAYVAGTHLSKAYQMPADKISSISVHQANFRMASRP